MREALPAEARALLNWELPFVGDETSGLRPTPAATARL
jgi:hypothetical protein